jgi:hypothetical protein
MRKSTTSFIDIYLRWILGENYTYFDIHLHWGMAEKVHLHFCSFTLSIIRDNTPSSTFNYSVE